MADHNANKINVQAQVEPTPAMAETARPASPAPREETAEVRDLLLSAYYSR